LHEASLLYSTRKKLETLDGMELEEAHTVFAVVLLGATPAFPPWSQESSVPPGLPISIIIMRIRIQLFTFMRIRILQHTGLLTIHFEHPQPYTALF
jgi:hypothetical protein